MNLRRAAVVAQLAILVGRARAAVAAKLAEEWATRGLAPNGEAWADAMSLIYDEASAGRPLPDTMADIQALWWRRWLACHVAPAGTRKGTKR